MAGSEGLFKKGAQDQSWLFQSWSTQFLGRDEPHKHHLLAPKCRDVGLSISFPLYTTELHFLVLPRSKLETARAVLVSVVKT